MKPGGSSKQFLTTRFGVGEKRRASADPVGPQAGHHIPGCADIELIDRAGHFWQEERADAFAAVIMAFLRKHLGGRTSLPIAHNEPDRAAGA